MHVDIAHSHQANGRSFTGLPQLVEPDFIAQGAQLLYAHPAPANEVLECPAPQRNKLLKGATALRRYHDKAVCQRSAFDQRQAKLVSALRVRRAPQMRYEFAQVAVAIEVAGQDNQVERLAHAKFSITVNLKL
jgi:hypothetical protein